MDRVAINIDLVKKIQEIPISPTNLYGIALCGRNKPRPTNPEPPTPKNGDSK